MKGLQHPVRCPTGPISRCPVRGHPYFVAIRAIVGPMSTKAAILVLALCACGSSSITTIATTGDCDDPEDMADDTVAELMTGDDGADVVGTGDGTGGLDDGDSGTSGELDSSTGEQGCGISGDQCICDGFRVEPSVCGPCAVQGLTCICAEEVAPDSWCEPNCEIVGSECLCDGELVDVVECLDPLCGPPYLDMDDICTCDLPIVGPWPIEPIFCT